MGFLPIDPRSCTDRESRIGSAYCLHGRRELAATSALPHRRSHRGTSPVPGCPLYTARSLLAGRSTPNLFNRPAGPNFPDIYTKCPQGIRLKPFTVFAEKCCHLRPHSLFGQPWNYEWMGVSVNISPLDIVSHCVTIRVLYCLWQLLGLAGHAVR
jgi:hypothetical protein